MSRSNNLEIKSPAKYHFEWVGSKGCLKYFDKSIGEKGDNVLVKLPFSFLVLDKLHTIKGFSDQDQSGFWSNEIRDVKKETLTVRTKKGIVGTGVYSTLAHILNQGAQYSQSVYIAYKGEEGLVIANIQMTGSSIGPWIDFNKKVNVYKTAIVIKSALPAKKGTNNFFIPVFDVQEIAPNTEEKAIEMDKELQEYLTEYFKRSGTEQREAVNDQVVSRSSEHEPDYSEVNKVEEPVDDFDSLPF